MDFRPIFMYCVCLVLALAGCSAPEEIAGGALQASAGAMNTAGENTVGAANTAGQATVGAVKTVGEAGLVAIGHSSEGAAAVVRGTGEAATEATGGQGGVAKEVKKAADDFAKPKTVDFMGNEVVIDPSEDKKIRMAF